MKKFILLILAILIVAHLVIADDFSSNAKVIEAQNALNTPGFSAASAFGVTFSDSINPATGALTISETDVVVPGRNGMDVVLTRKYSSNIFLNINDNQGSPYCNGPVTGTGINDIEYEKSCQDCLPPTYLPQTLAYNSYPYSTSGLNTEHCASSNGEQASFIRAKYLGRGWTMNYLENRLKDVTPLVFTSSGSSDIVDYRFVPSRGINSQSIVVNGEEKSLILPSMFRQTSSIISPDYFFWGTDIAFDASQFDQYTDMDGMSCDNAPDFVCRQSFYFAGDYFTQDSYGLIGSSAYMYIAYTDDLAPVQINNQKSTEKAPLRILPQATLFNKDGRIYYYQQYVPFCGDFDEIPGDSSGYCSDLIPNQLTFYEIINWAENPYAGTYLRFIRDNQGNEIQIKYHGDFSTTPLTDRTPFIEKITAPGSNTAKFYYDDDQNNELNINSRLEYITYSGPMGEVYRVYEYDSGDSEKPLLRRTCLAKVGPACSGEGNLIAGTLTTYDYDQNTQELTKVKLPTGAEIEYTYAWHSAIPVIDAVRGEEIHTYSTLNNKPARRVVVKRSVNNGGLCELPNGQLSSYCEWNYNYEKINSGASTMMKTTIIDPKGYQTEILSYPATASTLAKSYE